MKRRQGILFLENVAFYLKKRQLLKCVGMISNPSQFIVSFVLLTATLSGQQVTIRQLLAQ